MKKLALLLLTLFVLTACSEGEKFANKQQQQFNNMLLQYQKEGSQIKNEIRQNEFYSSVRKDFAQYMDSVILFVNWKGHIQNIKSHRHGQASFKLFYHQDKEKKVTFRVKEYIALNPETNPTYQTLKNLSDGAEVYFDGYITKDSDGEADIYGTDYTFVDPTIYFVLTDIYTTPKEHQLSDNLKKALEFVFKVNQEKKSLLSNTFWLFYSPKKDIMKKVMQPIKEKRNGLTEEEKAYLDNVCYSIFIQYGQRVAELYVNPEAN